MSGRPIDDPERLAALQRSGLLDSPREDAFDAQVELARDLLGGTVALVSLVDDRRQFFKAEVGLGEPWARDRQTPLTHSFCQHVVNGNAPFLVEDARTDARVSGSLAIEELGAIAYAGVPLVDEGAHTFGALCVFDGQPRVWTEKEVRTLKTLARAVMAEIHLRQALVHRQQEALAREQLLQSLQSTQSTLSESLERTRQVMEAAGAALGARKRAEAEREALARQVRAGEAQLRLVMDALPVLVSFVTAEERYGVVNKAYAEWFGIAEEQMRGREVREIIGEAAYAVLGPYVRRGLAGETFSFEQYGVPYRLGGTRDVKVSFISHRGAEGHVEGYVAMLQDVTRLRHLEREREEALATARRAQAQAEAERGRLEALSQRLAEREQLLRLVVESASMSAWSMDCHTQLITADERFLALYGLSPAEPVPLSAVLARMHPEDRPGTERAIAAALAGKNEGRYLSERRIQGPSGAYHWGETRAQVAFAPDGTPRTMQGVSFDVTARKEAEALREELHQRTRAESERQRLMFEQAPASIALLEGPEHRFRIANTRYVQLVGGRQVFGLSVAEALPEVVEQGFIALLDTVRRTGEPYVGRETWIQIQRNPGGALEDVCLDFVYQPIRDASSQVGSIFVHAVEVTDLVRSREVARRAMRDLEALAQQERLRAEFAQQLVGIVSHDLRNPLGAIRFGTTTLQQREELDPRAARTLERIQSATERAERMVRDLLDFTQVRLGGGLKIEPRPTDLHELVRGVVQEVEEAQPGVRILQETRGEGRGAWDADRLQQVVQNLVTNALKYGASGGRVEVFTEGHEDRVTLSVHNAGEPIAPERQASIFQPMQRGVEGVDRQGRSVGLGLFIVRAIVEAHGGTIELTSRAAEGTTFRIVLPRETARPSV